MSIEPRYRLDEYVEAVLSGRQVAGEYVRQAVERHVDDLEHGHERGLTYDVTAAAMAIAFYDVLRHWKGELAGQAIKLEPWQRFIVGSIFGWRREDGTRRFRTAYLEVARKNGKTTLAAGIGLYLLLMDKEPGAEVYTAATKRDQARLAHKDATEMVARSPQLKKLIATFKDNLNHSASSSKFEPLGRDANSTDGLNVHGVIADEVHAWKTAELWDVLETATGARRQPLMLGITTAGHNRTSLCYDLHDYTRKVNARIVEDDSFFGLIYSLDRVEDESGKRGYEDHTDEGVWIKANPNLDVSKKRDDIRRKLQRAEQMPARLNAFLKLELNQWTTAEERWLSPDVWRACSFDVDAEALAGRRCFAGLDLSSTTDISALVYVFPPEEDEELEDGRYEVLTRFWIPKDNLHERARTDRVPYEAWLTHGYIEATPGNVIDYDYILAQIDADRERYELAELAFDRWGAARIVTQLQARGIEVVQFGQGYASMNGPMRELEKMLLARELAHGGDPVLAWMADNMVAATDPAGNVKPDKSKSIEKIDGVVALIMALDRAVVAAEDEESVYEQRGVLTI